MKRIWPKGPDEFMPFVPAIEVESGDRLFYLAGCTALPLYHKHPHDPIELTPPPDMESQVRAVFANMKLVLDAIGADYSNIVKLTRYLTDIREQDILNKVQKEYLGEYLPTSTTVEVSKLVFPGLKLEIEAVVAKQGA